MSADGRTVCPKCHPDLCDYTGPKDYPHSKGLIDHAAEELGYDRSVRENYEYYFKAEEGQIFLIADYSATCWDCDWHFEVLIKTPVPSLPVKDTA